MPTLRKRTPDGLTHRTITISVAGINRPPVRPVCASVSASGVRTDDTADHAANGGSDRTTDYGARHRTSPDAHRRAVLRQGESWKECKRRYRGKRDDSLPHAVNPLFLITGSNPERNAWFRQIKRAIRMPASSTTGRATVEPCSSRILNLRSSHRIGSCLREPEAVVYQSDLRRAHPGGSDTHVCRHFTKQAC